MTKFMLWFPVVLGGVLGFIFGDEALRGALMLIAIFIALGAVVRAVDLTKKGGRDEEEN